MIYRVISTSDPKMIDVSKYGGYKKYTGAYFFLVEHTVRSLTRTWLKSEE